MGLWNSGRVHIVITNHGLRYIYLKNASLDSMIIHGELELPNETIKDGKIVNQAVFLEHVQKLVQQHKWKRKKLYFAVPDNTVVIRQLQIPAALTKEEAMGYVKTQIGNSFYLPFANPAIAIEFLETDEKNRDVLLFAYPKEKISAYEQLFEKAGLVPVVADITALSVYRYFYKQRQVEADNNLLVHWNMDSLALTAFQRHKAVFTRYIKLDIAGDINEEMAKQLINEYVIEINRIIDFYRFSITKGAQAIDSLLLTGDFPFLALLENELKQAVSIPIHRSQEEILPEKYVDVMGLSFKQDMR